MLFLIILTIILGILAGHFIISPSIVDCLEPVSTIFLALLLLGVGIDIGKNRNIIEKIKGLGFKIIGIPILIAVGSIVGAIIFGRLIHLPVNEAGAIGAGFGWYSLSGVLLARIYSSDIGALAFLTNVFRELLAIILIPIMASLGARISVIAPGGATTMDTTLPLITKAVKGAEIAVISFISGAILSALVPILVPLLIRM